MEREEAIKMIQDDMRLHHDYLSGEYRKALRMAVEALQAEQEGEPKFYDEDDYWNGRVPTHNRLINASLVINEIHKNVCDMCEQAIDIEDCNYCKIEKIKRIINSAPTVSVVDITQRDLCKDISCTDCPFMKETCKLMDYVAYADRPHGEWVSQIDTGTWMLECSVCGSRVQEEKYRIAVGEDATKCPYCGAELGLGGYLYDEYANRPSQRKGEDE